MLDFNPNVEQWQNRIISLRQWESNGDWPDVSTSHLLATNYEWLSPYLADVKKPEDLKRIDLKKVLQNHLSYESQQLLDKLAPERLQVPSGSNIKLEYGSRGEAPILAVRLQEIFGLLETPTVNNGSIKILLHLLSPGFKPVQVTDDLNSFWTNTYFEVKKELKARYPKHDWPDNPLEAEPLRGVKRRGPKN